MDRREQNKNSKNRIYSNRKHVVTLFLTFSIIVFFTIILFVQDLKRHKTEEKSYFDTLLISFQISLDSILNHRLNSVYSMAAFAEHNPDAFVIGPDRNNDSFIYFASSLHSYIPDIRSIQIAPNGVVSYIYPIEGNESALGHDLLNDPNRRDDVLRTIERADLTLAGPLELVQGGLALIGRLPIFADEIPWQDAILTEKGYFWGMGVVLIDIPPLLAVAGVNEHLDEVKVAIRSVSEAGIPKSSFFGEDVLFKSDSLRGVLMLPDGSWEIAFTPIEGWSNRSPFSLFILISGFASAVFISLAVHLFLSMPLRLQLLVDERTYELNQEIRERKIKESEIKSLKNHLADIIDFMPSMIIGINSDEIITQWNAETEKKTGISRYDAYGSKLEVVLPSYKRYSDVTAKSIESGTTQLKYKLKHIEEGKQEIENITVYPLNKEDSKGAIIRIDNVTDQVRLEEKMVQNEKLLSIGGLAAGMAHEINNPLGGMIQTSQALFHRLDDKDIPANRQVAEELGLPLDLIHLYLKKRKVFDMLNQIHESGVTASEIVHNMLSFARKDDDMFSSHFLDELINKCIDLCSLEYDVKSAFDFKRVEIIRIFKRDLPPVQCISGKIQQTVINILMNGAEAMNETNRKSRFIIRLYDDQDKGMQYIEIEDNGPGISKEIKNRIFEPFFTTKSVGRGTGLGLSVSYFIIKENHGGELSVESGEGHGSVFKIGLPVNRKQV